MRVSAPAAMKISLSICSNSSPEPPDVGRPAAGSTGFSGASAPKPEEHVTQLLELYSRCLKAVEGKGAGQ